MWLPRLAADLAVRAERQKRLETFRRLTGRDPEDLAPDEERSLNGFDNPPASLAVAPNGFVWAAGVSMVRGPLRAGLGASHVPRAVGRFGAVVSQFPGHVFFAALVDDALGSALREHRVGGQGRPTRLLPDGQVDPVYSTKGGRGAAGLFPRVHGPADRWQVGVFPIPSGWRVEPR